MRKLLLLASLLLLSCLSFGQASSFTSWAVNAAGKPIPATVRVCTYTATPVIPCVGPVTLYIDQVETSTVTNPISTDGSGNFTIFATPGYYTVQTCVPNTTLCVTQTILLPISTGSDAVVNSISFSGSPSLTGVCPSSPLNPALFVGVQALAVDSDCEWKLLIGGAFRSWLPQLGTATLVAGTKSVTFAQAFQVTPVCVASEQTTTGATSPKLTPSPTQLVIAGTGTDVIAWACFPNPN